MSWVLLGLAIVSEVTGTLALRASEGFSRLGPSVIVVFGYAVAFLLMSFALKELGVSAVYATWSGVGTVGVAIGGYLLFAERLTAWTVVGMGLILAGVLVMNLLGNVEHG